MAEPMMFHANIEWRGEKFGEGFVGEERSSRGILGAPPAFGGMKGLWNPEDLICASLSSCSMLSFLVFAQKEGIDVKNYTNHVVGTLTKGQNGFVFTKFVVTVDVTVGAGQREITEKALKSGERFCISSNSLCAEKELVMNITEQ